MNCLPFMWRKWTSSGGSKNKNRNGWQELTTHSLRSNFSSSLLGGAVWYVHTLAHVVRATGKGAVASFTHECSCCSLWQGVLLVMHLWHATVDLAARAESADREADMQLARIVSCHDAWCVTACQCECPSTALFFHSFLHLVPGSFGLWTKV